MADSNQFREYLTKSGGEEAMWKILIKLDKLRTKPENPVEYIREHMDSNLSEHFANLKQEIEEVKGKIEDFAQAQPRLYEKYLKRKNNAINKGPKKKVK